MIGWSGRRWRISCALVLFVALAATVPTTGDIGLTWDEPAYKYSQVMSGQWWEQLAAARTRADLDAILTPDALLYYWPYGRFGINFHPPLAGQLNLFTHAIFGRWMKDIPARRMASVIEYSLTIAILFGFLARRYGPWVGVVAAASLLLMPRVYGDGHIAGTDMPGLLLWAATTIAFWNGLHAARGKGRWWRAAVGILLGLTFVEKMGGIAILLPLLSWLAVGYLPGTLRRRGGKADWTDGVLTSLAMLIPLGLAFLEIVRLSQELLDMQARMGIPRGMTSPSRTNLFQQHPTSYLPAAILLAPLGVWIARRIMGRALRDHPVWGVERPALETWTAILAFAPAVGWLGNPAWWRETLPRLAHYYAINSTRRGVLPDIQIMYFGQTYQYSLPWPNAWVLIAITVPAGILAAAVAGLAYALGNARRDRLALFFLIQLTTLPIMRMLPTPAHDGVRLFLPTFFFLAALAGWGLVWTADSLAARCFPGRAVATRLGLAALVLGSAAWQLVRIHPFELSYYNELIGGPRGAWRHGFELTYWYDAFNTHTLADLNERLPGHAKIAFPNELSRPPTFMELQALGALRGDIELADDVPGEPAFRWLPTHDSKADAFTRLLFAMTPWYERRPSQLDGLRVATVADPIAVSRAFALQLLVDGTDDRPNVPSDRAPFPDGLRQAIPWLARFWGEGITRAPRLGVNRAILDWAKDDPKSLLTAAREIAEADGGPIAIQDETTRKLMRELEAVRQTHP